MIEYITHDEIISLVFESLFILVVFPVVFVFSFHAVSSLVFFVRYCLFSKKQ